MTRPIREQRQRTWAIARDAYLSCGGEQEPSIRLARKNIEIEFGSLVVSILVGMMIRLAIKWIIRWVTEGVEIPPMAFDDEPIEGAE